MIFSDTYKIYTSLAHAQYQSSGYVYLQQSATCIMSAHTYYWLWNSVRRRHQLSV